MTSRVLIIEDEPDIRKTIDYNLSKESFKVFQAGSIAEGEQSISDNSPDVIILRFNASRWLRLNSCAETLNQTIKLNTFPLFF